jgi:1,4-dihydroxy-6-naphthoate synthase
MFWAWVHARLESRVAVRPHLADIQELNRLVLTGAPLPLTKASASTYLDPKVQERYRLLNVGAALGRGCGPLIVSARPYPSGLPEGITLAIPGRDTTACRLARAAVGEQVREWVELRYDQIMPAVLEKAVDAGVIIHESRFAYQSLGLHLAFDLGRWWEELTSLPLPLGVMLARRDLDEAVVQEVERTLRSSLQRGWELLEGHQDLPEAHNLWSYLRDHATELDDATIAAHIKLYVNEHSLELGQEGHRALERFARLTRAI